MDISVIYEKMKQLNILLQEKVPVGLPFEVGEKKYFYDTATNIIFECNDIEYIILNNILEDKRKKCFEMILDKTTVDKVDIALDNLINLIQEYGILNRFQYMECDNINEIRQSIDTKLIRLSIEVTQKCNLKCGYCITNNKISYRNDMSKETAFKAMEYALLHSIDSEELTIGFFGGEPLLRFDLILACIEYVMERAEGRKVSFAITTNGTLITEEVARKLASIENLTVSVSIDGPQNIHDVYRKNCFELGSYEQTLKGLHLLVNEFGDKAEESLILSLVYTPPYSIDKLESIRRFFDQLEWIPPKIRKNIAYPVPESILQILEYSQQQYANIDELREDSSLIDWSIQQYQSNKQLATISIESEYTRIKNREIFIKSNAAMKMNGCCIPGQSIYVLQDGHFGICERCNEITIGNLELGVDYKKIQRLFFEDYIKKSFEKCSNCWLARLCNICYSKCYNCEGINIQKKERSCERLKREMKKVIISYVGGLS